jgi:hypothetical protein
MLRDLDAGVKKLKGGLFCKLSQNNWTSLDIKFLENLTRVMVSALGIVVDP